MIRLRVKKQSADSEKEKFIVVMKGSADLGLSTLVDVELKLNGKEEGILAEFPMSSVFTIELEAKTE